MSDNKIKVEATVHAPIAKAWEAYVSPEHIVHWNFASPDWACPAAEADLRVGGKFKSRMEAKDGSMGFDFEGEYTKVNPPHELAYQFGDRTASIVFVESAGATKVTVEFDPENENPLDFQRQGWQSILNSFAHYAEGLA